MSLSTTLNQAVKLQERINGLRKQLSDLLNKARQEHASASGGGDPRRLATRRQSQRQSGEGCGAEAGPRRREARQWQREPGGRERSAAKLPATRKGRGTAKTNSRSRGSLAGRKRASSPSGPLAPAVVQVLQASGKPMRVADILEGLFKNGYTFSSPEPKKNLAARIYRLNGVKQVAGGLFAQV